MRRLLLAGLLPLALPLHSPIDDVSLEYTKFPLADTYAASCEQVDKNFGREQRLLVRRYLSDVHELVVNPGSPNAGSGGFERYMDGTKEGTFYPYDQDPLSGWCGHGDDGGDRVTWIVFDLNDFSHDAIARATLRLTPDVFPARATVRVDGPCVAAGGVSQPWHESEDFETTLNWRTMPRVAQDDVPLCTWHGDDALLYYERPVECDVTSTVVSAAHRAALDNVSSTVCFRLSAGVSASAPPAGALPDSFHRTYRRRAVTFFSRELDDATRRSVHHDDRALERGTVAEAQNTQRPNLLIEGSGCGEFPDHVNRDAASCGSWRAQDYTQAPIPAPTPRPTWIPSPQPTPETMPTPVPVPAPSSLPTPLLPNATWPPTVSPTTSAPTTSAPTSAPTSTMVPTTSAPTTSAPTTSAPTTSAPTTNSSS